VSTPLERDHAPDPGPKPLPGTLAFVGLGTSVAACVAVGVVLGIVGDDYFHTSPMLMVVGLVLGVASAVFATVAQIKRYL
jgi:F0F1-type ATP synthase assembly protein I